MVVLVHQVYQDQVDLPVLLDCRGHKDLKAYLELLDLLVQKVKWVNKDFMVLRVTKETLVTEGCQGKKEAKVKLENQARRACLVQD